jgi:hypothetical protein
MPDWAIVVAPGVLRMAGRDLEQSYWADARAILPSRPGRKPGKRTEVTAWTRKSRAKMTLTLASLDWSYLGQVTGLPAMVTLTYPGDWLTVAPSGKAVKAHLQAFLVRWERAWGEPLTGAWKLEFQDRGAPHVHIGPVVVPLGKAGDGRRLSRQAEAVLRQRAQVKRLRRAMANAHPDRGGTSEGFIAAKERYDRALRVKPRASRPAVGDGLPFNRWLSAVWADIVNHPDPAERERHLRAGTGVDYAEGLRCADPKRLAIYFSKHGSRRDKEYQNTVPDEWREQGKGPGRFWGYWNIKPCRVMVELSRDEHLLMSRTLRRLSERSAVWNPETRRVETVKATRDVAVRRRRTDPLTGEVRVRKRKVRRPVRRLKYHRGFVCVNDAPKLAAELARLVEGMARADELPRHVPDTHGPCCFAAGRG